MLNQRKNESKFLEAKSPQRDTKPMRLQLVRNATLKLDYAGRKVLIDPFFAPKHSRPSIAGRSPNPLVDLPSTIDEILDGVELVIVSHLHADHFDPVAQAHVPKHLPIICQPGDETKIRAMGFSEVMPLIGSANWQSITVTYRAGRHGNGAVVEKMGPVMGFSLAAVGEPRVYWAGDTVLSDDVRNTLTTTAPDIVVLHPSGALWEGDPIAMTAADALEVCRAAPGAVVVATHLEALDHATVSRDALASDIASDGLAGRLLVPLDGQTLNFANRV
jgi:L-ascorbate metabolism protein UlaG (beta-lactamase superfamily)